MANNPQGMTAQLYANQPMPNMPMRQNVQPTALPGTLPAGGPSQTPYAQSGNGLPSYLQGWPSQDQSSSDWLNEAYPTFLGRAPDQQGYDYWLSRLNDGVAPSAVADSMRNSPEALINGLFGPLLGRKPDQEGYAHYADMIEQPGGYDMARNEIMNSTEARNYLLGDGFRDYARASTAGMNQMPYVYSDYTATVPGYRNVPKSPLEALFGESAGQDTINSLQGLLGGIFAPDPVKEEDKPEDEADEKNKAPILEFIRQGGGRGGYSIPNPDYVKPTKK